MYVGGRWRQVTIERKQLIKPGFGFMRIIKSRSGAHDGEEDDP
jgi:hypothetical protein